MTVKVHKIDAKGIPLGRVATKAAIFLRGKDSPSYKPNIVPKTRVCIENASLLKISNKKLEQKEYKRYTGYPGGLRTQTLSHVIDNKGYGEVIRRAVRGMLPANKLRNEMLKNLVITD